MPLVPASIACQNASRPTPIGQTTPKPVMTTSRGVDIESSNRR
jgi:hypothetical protein